jgi:glutathione S-transferase
VGFAPVLVRRTEIHYLQSLADIATWLCLAFGQTPGADFSSYAHLQAWYARMLERPAVLGEFRQIMATTATA